MGSKKHGHWGTDKDLMSKSDYQHMNGAPEVPRHLKVRRKTKVCKKLKRPHEYAVYEITDIKWDWRRESKIIESRCIGCGKKQLDWEYKKDWVPPHHRLRP